MKRSLQYIFPLLLILLASESLYARTAGSDTTSNYQISPKLVIDLHTISVEKIFAGQQMHLSILKRKSHSSSSQFNFTTPPQFTLDFANVNLLKLKDSGQLIRYIRSDSGEHTISIISNTRGERTKSIIIHDNFIGIGINDKSRHFIFGKDRNAGKINYSAKWGYRF
ncbi:MAG: hypothetical protein OEL79_00030 [Chromatiales bacterium]|nr:hypothetical protein [Chromatiales bacterium]